MNKSNLKYYCFIGLLCLFTIFTLQIGDFKPNQNLKSNAIDFSEIDIISTGLKLFIVQNPASLQPCPLTVITNKVSKRVAKTLTFKFRFLIISSRFPFIP